MTRFAYRGADKVIGYHFPTGTDLTGYSAVMTIYNAMGGTLLLTVDASPTAAGSIVTVDPSGVITSDLKADDIDAIPLDENGAEGPTLVYFDLIMTTADSTEIKLDGGPLAIKAHGAPLGGCCEEITVSIDGDCYELDFCNTTFARGVAGSTGAQGVQGETGSPGRVGDTGSTGAAGINGSNIVPKGAYNAATTYNPLEGVQYLGSFYYLGGASTSLGVAPPNSPWVLAVSKGADGTTVTTGGIQRRYYIDIPNTIVDWMDNNGYFIDYFSPAGNWTSPETRRLDTIESTGLTIRYYSDEFTGALDVSLDNAVLSGKLINGPVADGALPQKAFFCDVRGTVGSRTIWIGAPGITTFQISNGNDTGDNFGAYILGSYVYWLNSVTGKRREPLFIDGATMPSGLHHLRQVVWTGQSTSNGTANVSTVSSTAVKPGYVLMFNAGSRVLQNDQGPTRNLEKLPDNSLWSLVDAYEQVTAVSGETQVTQCSYELQWRLGSTYAVVGSTVGIGSQAYNNMKKGTIPYQNLLDVVRTGYLAAKLNGLSYDVAICLPEFEAEQLDGQATYYAILQQFQADLTADINLLCNRSGEVVLCSDGYANYTSYGYETSEESLAQLQAAITAPTKFIYSGPAYLYPAIVADNIHRTPAGAALDGAYNGRALSKYFKGQDPLPLYVESFSVVSGGYVDLQLHKPYNSNSLTITSGLVTALTNHGVTCTRQDNGAAVSVFSVTLTNAALYQVRVALSAPPSGVPLWLEVGGYRGVAGQPSGPVTGARSPVNDACGDTSYFGTPMANHWAQQRLSVTF